MNHTSTPWPAGKDAVETKISRHDAAAGLDFPEGFRCSAGWRGGCQQAGSWTPLSPTRTCLNGRDPRGL
jgi:hypothetical protein